VLVPGDCFRLHHADHRLQAQKHFSGSHALAAGGYGVLLILLLIVNPLLSLLAKSYSFSRNEFSRFTSRAYSLPWCRGMVVRITLFPT
jgi:hypothetical protein